MTEYKCPKCKVWEIGNLIENNKMKCLNCGYIGIEKDFKAKSYLFYTQSIIRVIAFNDEDAKNEFESMKEDFVPYFDEIIKIEEGD